MDSNNIILQLDKLKIGYKTRKTELAIGPTINLGIKSGEFIGIIGSNGIGKSTFLRTISGVQPPLKGQILIHKKDLSSITNIERAQLLSIVLTEPLATRNLNVKELIALGRQPYTNWLDQLADEDIKFVEQAIEKLGLTAFQHKKCFELSDGQLQKVLIARAMAQNTDLIILDEPTTHLDLYHKTQILKTLKFLVEDLDKTILFSSHEIDLCIQLCDRLILMLPDEVILGTAIELIEAGKFDKLFDSDLVEFDKISKSFKVKK